MKRFIVRGLILLLLLLQGTAFADVIRTARDLQNAVDGGDLDRVFELEARIIQSPKMKLDFFMAEDRTGIVRLSDRRADNSRTLQPGDRVIVSGRTRHAPDSSLLIAACRTIRLLAHEPLPDAETVSAHDFLRGACDNRRIALRGTVRDVFNDDIDNLYAFMVLDSGEQSVYVSYRGTRDACSALQDYIGCEILVSGIGEGTSPGYRLFPVRYFSLGTTNDIRIVRRPSSDRFDAPDIATWRAVDPQEISSSGLRRARGTVIARWHGDTVLLANDSGRPVRVVCAEQTPPELNARVEAVGTPTTDLFHINLKRAVWRPCGPSVPPKNEALPRTPLSTLFRGTAGYPLIRSMSHGDILRVEGLVKGHLTDETGSCKILLADGDESILVDCSMTPEILDRAAEGSRVAVTGVCVMESDDWSPNSAFPRVKGLFLVPRTADDVTVLARPPWWTPGRFALALALLLALLFAVFVWNVTLRILIDRRSREVIRAQTAKIESELRIGERTRLAAELHDNTVQNLTAIAYRVSAAQGALGEREPETGRILQVVAKMLKSCRTSLRQCLWDLRNDALNEPDFGIAIRRTVEPVAGDAKLSVRFSGRRDLINDTTAHAILNILRELVSNATVHGGATAVSIAGEARPGVIRFSVSDNGTGFDPVHRPGQDDGHFGLDGIQERLETLGGTLAIESASGRGTYVRISIQPTSKHLNV